jgi:hypothetical protein
MADMAAIMKIKKAVLFTTSERTANPAIRTTSPTIAAMIGK